MPVRPPEVRRIDFSSDHQYYTFWSPAAALQSRGHVESARCSWCQAETKHLLVEHHKILRNVYECAACARRTVPCRKSGCTSMCKGGLWDNERCSLCAKEIVAWPLTDTERIEQREAIHREVQAARRRAEASLRKRPAMLRTGIAASDFSERHNVEPSEESDDSSDCEDDSRISRSSSSSDDDVPTPPPRRVEVTFPEDGKLGISFHRNSQPPFAIAKFAPDTLAAREPRLQVGMALVSLQGVPTADLSYDEVIARLRAAGRPLFLIFEHTWLSG